MLRNELVAVDIFDRELGVVTKQQAHERPILHRAFSVFLVNKDGKILIQQRAFNKYHSGGLWANACCSHPRSGEDVVESARARLKEELNITADLTELFSFVYLHKFNDNLYEYEYDHVLLGEYNGAILLNTTEASAFRWVTPDKLAEELSRYPEKFASWFITCAPKVLEILKNR